MKQYIESCLALYDLNVDCQHYNKDGNYNDYFFEKKLENGLKIKCRSDAYYVLDFSEAPIGKPVEYKQPHECNTLYIRNERVEVLHAFLACLRHTTQQKTQNYHHFDMKFIDNYIICAKKDCDLDKLFNDSQCFSSDYYKESCNKKLIKIKKEWHNNNQYTGIDNTAILENTCKTMDTITQNNDGYSLYALGVLYRAAVYYNLGLEMHSAIFIRTVFEWLAKLKFTKVNKPVRYDKLLKFCNIENNGSQIMIALKALRENAIHELKFPKTAVLQSPISEGFRITETIYNKIFGSQINIPLGQSQNNFLEPY